MVTRTLATCLREGSLLCQNVTAVGFLPGVWGDWGTYDVMKQRAYDELCQWHRVNVPLEHVCRDCSRAFCCFCAAEFVQGRCRACDLASNTDGLGGHREERASSSAMGSHVRANVIGLARQAAHSRLRGLDGGADDAADSAVGSHVRANVIGPAPSSHPGQNGQQQKRS